MIIDFILYIDTRKKQSGENHCQVLCKYTLNLSLFFAPILEI